MNQERDGVSLEYRDGFDPRGTTLQERVNNIVSLSVKGTEFPSEFDATLSSCLNFALNSVSEIPLNVRLPACKKFDVAWSPAKRIPTEVLETLQECESFKIVGCANLSLTKKLYLPKCRYFEISWIKSCLFHTLKLPSCLNFALRSITTVFLGDNLEFLQTVKTITLSDCNFTKITTDGISSPSVIVLPLVVNQCLSLDLSSNKIREISFPSLPRCKEIIFNYDEEAAMAVEVEGSDFFEYARNPDTPVVYYAHMIAVPKETQEVFGGTEEEFYEKASVVYRSGVHPENVASKDARKIVLDGWPHAGLPKNLSFARCKKFTIKNSQLVEIPKKLLRSLRKKCGSFVLKNNPKFRGLPPDTEFEGLEIFEVRNTYLGYVSNSLATSLSLCSLIILDNAGLVMLPDVSWPNCLALSAAQNSLTFLFRSVVRSFGATIEQLHLSSNRFENPDDLFRGCEELPRCTYLDLSNNPLQTFSELPGLPACQTLDVSGTAPVTSQSIAYLEAVAPQAEIVRDDLLEEDSSKEEETPSEEEDKALPAFDRVLRCVNAQETFSQEEWSDEFAPDLYIWKLPDVTPDMVLCYDSESLSSWLSQSTNLIAKWIETPGRTMDDMGRGGRPSETERYAQIYDASGTSSYPIYVTLNSVYRKLKRGGLTNVILGAVKVDRVRVGNLQGIFGVSALHGQLPPVDIYELDVLGKISR